MTESPKPLGMSDFFALEAGEYLERLDGMLAKGDSPSADEIVRLARALRGSALMANQPAIARAAAGLEVLARAVREGRRAWDPQTQQLALRAVDDLKIFVRRAGSWTDADTAKAEPLAGEPERAIGELSRSGLEPPTNLGELFHVAGSAIARAAREVAERGRPDPEGPDFRQFAGLLVKLMESEPDAVSIGSLYYSDSGPHIVSRGVPAPCGGAGGGRRRRRGQRSPPPPPGRGARPAPAPPPPPPGPPPLRLLLRVPRPRRGRHHLAPRRRWFPG